MNVADTAVGKITVKCFALFIDFKLKTCNINYIIQCKHKMRSVV